MYVSNKSSKFLKSIYIYTHTHAHILYIKAYLYHKYHLNCNCCVNDRSNRQEISHFSSRVVIHFRINIELIYAICA